MSSATNQADPLDFLPNELRKKWTSLKGWLLPEAAKELNAASASASEDGRIVEVGSFAGKSTVCIAWAQRGRKTRTPKPVVAVDIRFQRSFRKNLRAFGVDTVVEPLEMMSLEACERWRDPISFLYIDGHHGDAHALADLVTWESFVLPGCIMAFDDTAGHMTGPIRAISAATTSGACERLFEVGGITFLRKLRPLFPGLGRFPVEKDTSKAQLAAAAAWIGATDPLLRPSMPPGLRTRHQRRTLGNILNSVRGSLSSLPASHTRKYLLAVTDLQMGNAQAAIGTLLELKHVAPDETLETHNLRVLPFALLRLAQAHDMLGQREQAAALYKEVAALDVPSTLRSAAQDLLSQPFKAPPLQSDILLREYVIRWQVPESRTY